MRSGRLFVKCPAEGCGRSLQTLELKDTLPGKDYELLVTRLQEAEDSVEGGYIPGLELRYCPKCHVKMEKNEGCDSMVCYRCGHGFRWSEAKMVKKPADATVRPHPSLRLGDLAGFWHSEYSNEDKAHVVDWEVFVDGTAIEKIQGEHEHYSDPGSDYHFSETKVKAKVAKAGGAAQHGGWLIKRRDGWVLDPSSTAARAVWRKPGDPLDGLLWERRPQPEDAAPAAEAPLRSPSAGGAAEAMGDAAAAAEAAVGPPQTCPTCNEFLAFLPSQHPEHRQSWSCDDPNHECVPRPSPVWTTREHTHTRAHLDMQIYTHRDPHPFPFLRLAPA